jgi:hypothetical protein
MKTRTILIAYIIFMLSVIGTGYYYQTKELCFKQSTKDPLGVEHRTKCKES